MVAFGPTCELRSRISLGNRFHSPANLARVGGLDLGGLHVRVLAGAHDRVRSAVVLLLLVTTGRSS